MVYRGVPSKGCLECRRRKIGCDLGMINMVGTKGREFQLKLRLEKPSCGNCRSRDRVCPGYRNEQEIRFYHENDDILRKVQVREERKLNRSKLPRDVLDKSLGSIQTLSVEIEDVATNFFFSNYIFLGRPQGLRDYFPKMYNKGGATSVFATAAVCVGTYDTLSFLFWFFECFDSYVTILWIL